jgi:PAS domain S-box-containing protein
MGSESAPFDAAILVVQSPDGMIFADRDGVIRVWNDAAERIFGFASEVAIGQNLDIIIPENLREAHWTGYDRALAAGETKYSGQSLPTKAVRSDGSTIYVELSFAIVKDATGVIGALAHARDISERFDRDRTARRRMRALEQALEAAGAALPASG